MSQPIILTARGRMVRDFIIIAAVVAAALWVLDMTTPEICKVPVEEMSGACKRLLFP